MNKNELIGAVANRGDMTRKEAEAAINATLDSIMEALIDEEKVQILGFGTFETKKRPERTGRNPQTGEPMIIPASKTVSFKIGKGLKDQINHNQL